MIDRPRRELGRLRTYNQFPRHYDCIHEMTDDLQRIADMGFTSVWINPIFESCQSIEYAREMIHAHIDELNSKGEFNYTISKHKKIHSKPDSPYSIRSFELDNRYNSNINDVISYTNKARELGLTPMTDLVMRHIAIDSSLVTNQRTDFPSIPNCIDTSKWFKKYPDGRLQFFNRAEDYSCNGQSWEDVAAFDFENDKIRSEIIEYYLKPMIKKFVNEFGFMGFRIDAAGMIPSQVYDEIIPFMDSLCIEKFGVPSVTLLETLGSRSDEFKFLSGYADYLYNSLYFIRWDDEEYWKDDRNGFNHSKGARILV